jgi:hypothetical protein
VLRSGSARTRAQHAIRELTVGTAGAPAAASPRRSESRAFPMRSIGCERPRARSEAGKLRGPRRAKFEIGGGAGSCTRVRKYIPAGIYDAYPRLKCRSRREGAARTAGSQPRKISPAPSGTASASQPAEMTSVPHPQAGEDGRSQVFTLRERAAYPQLGLFHLLTRVMVLGTHPAKPYLRRI